MALTWMCSCRAVWKYASKGVENVEKNCCGCLFLTFLNPSPHSQPIKNLYLMQKVLSIAALFLLLTSPLAAQRFFTRDAGVKFDATSPLEKIEGFTKSGTCVLDIKTGKMEWKVLIKGFQMEKALMQEHFNENYMESTQYPHAQFQGLITNLGEVNFAQDGKYAAQVKGQLTMHGVTKELDVSGIVKVSGGHLTLGSTLQVAAADYGISIPGVVRDKIAKTIKVTVEALLKPM